MCVCVFGFFPSRFEVSCRTQLVLEVTNYFSCESQISQNLASCAEDLGASSSQSVSADCPRRHSGATAVTFCYLREKKVCNCQAPRWVFYWRPPVSTVLTVRRGCYAHFRGNWSSGRLSDLSEFTRGIIQPRPIWHCRITRLPLPFIFSLHECRKASRGQCGQTGSNLSALRCGCGQAKGGICVFMRTCRVDERQFL